MDKIKILIAWMRARIGERSTWAFWFGSGAIAFFAPYPASVVMGLVVFFAGFIPDSVVIGKTDG